MKYGEGAGHRARAFLGFLLPALFAAIGLGLSLSSFLQARGTAERQLGEAFRFDAYQRSELVLRALEGSRRDFEALLRFYSASEEVTREELELYARPLLDEGILRGLLWLGPEAARRLEASGALGAGPGLYFVPSGLGAELARSGRARSAIVRALGLAMAAAPASGPGAQALPYLLPGVGASEIAVAARLPEGRGEGRGGFLVALVSLEGAMRLAIGSSPLVGLPTSIYDLSGPLPRLLKFHAPRLDASLGRPVRAPNTRAELSAERDFVYFGLPLSLRVEASPAYLASRRSSAAASALVLGLALSALGALYARRLLSRGAAAEDAAAASSRELERYFALGRDLYCIADEKGRIRRVNGEWERALGYGAAALVGRPLLSLVLREDRAATKLAMRSLVRGEDVDGFEHRVRTAEGGFLWLEWRAAADPGSRLAYAAARDVTERRRAEALLKASIREKEILIREIHHRVKNNMQVVSSLVSLESRASRGGAATEGELRIQGLVRAMSLVHEAAYTSLELDAVKMAPYLRDLVAAEASIASKDGMRIEVRVGEGSLDLERATLCGLAVDELVANSLRCAAGGRAAGCEEPELLVEGGESEGGGFWLAVRDNGPGIPGLAERGRGIGLPLVEALVAQMGGKLRIAGSSAEIRLPAAASGV